MTGRHTRTLRPSWQPLHAGRSLMPTYTLQRVNCVVVTIASLFVFVYCVACTTLLPRSLSSTSAFLQFWGFTIATGFGLYCYILCVVSDPGWVPDNYQHDPEDPATTYIQVKKKSGGPRYCQKCSKPKPPRAHHCRVCGRCVLRMDHHCPWINNCVGHGNYKAFVLLLLYTEVALCQASASLCYAVSKVLSEHERGARVHGIGQPPTLPAAPIAPPEPTTHQDAIVVAQLMALAVAAPFALGVGALLIWHIYSVSQNQTTVEHHEGVTAHDYYRRMGHSFRHPYDLGCISNCREVLGPNVCLWLVPALSAAGPGTTFPHNLRGLDLESVQSCEMQPICES